MKKLIIASIMALWVAGGTVKAEEEVAVEETGFFIPLAEDKPYIHVLHEGKSIKIQRVQDPEYELRGYFARTGRKCPPFCLRPMEAHPGVKTVGEVELFDFMENELRDDTGLLIDARTPAWFQKGTIPGSINVPFTVLSKPPSDPEMVAVLKSFGAKPRGDVGTVDRLLEEWGLKDDSLVTKDWDFSEAKTLLLWCNGPFCGQSPRAVKGLVESGYPPEKLLYYRGGMQVWQLFGLTTIIPGT
jgi:rhodanese-related sulfurtransferase